METTNQYFPKESNILVDDIRQLTIIKKSEGIYRWIKHSDDDCIAKIKSELGSCFNRILIGDLLGDCEYAKRSQASALGCLGSIWDDDRAKRHQSGYF